MRSVGCGFLARRLYDRSLERMRRNRNTSLDRLGNKSTSWEWFFAIPSLLLWQRPTKRCHKSSTRRHYRNWKQPMHKSIVTAVALTCHRRSVAEHQPRDGGFFAPCRLKALTPNAATKQKSIPHRSNGQLTQLRHDSSILFRERQPHSQCDKHGPRYRPPNVRRPAVDLYPRSQTVPQDGDAEVHDCSGHVEDNA